MNILGLEKSSGANRHYRLLQPLYKLQEHGMANILTLQSQESSDLQFVTEKILESEIMVFPCPFGIEWLNLIKVARKHGKIVVLDYDDDPFYVSPFNPAYRHFGTEEARYKFPDGQEMPLWEDQKDGFFIERNITRRDIFKAAIKNADLVSVTTDILRKSFLHLNKNVTALPNLMDFALYPKCEFVKKDIRIGYQGGSSHYEDLYMIHGVLRRVLEKFPSAKLVYWGDMRFHGLFKGIPKDRIEWHSWVAHNAYPYKLSTLNLDIGLCPVVDNQFNKNKSAIKYFEYTAVGAATVASDIPPYTPVITNDRDGILVKNDNDAWYGAIVSLIMSRGKREALAKNAYENVGENYSIDKKVHLWRDAYEKLLNKKVEDLVEA